MKLALNVQQHSQHTFSMGELKSKPIFMGRILYSGKRISLTSRIINCDTLSCTIRPSIRVNPARNKRTPMYNLLRRNYYFIAYVYIKLNSVLRFARIYL